MDDATNRIHIDQHPFQSPNPTSGLALYALGQVKEGRVLYREVNGDREDKPVAPYNHHVKLKPDEHFHSGDRPDDAITIVVNGTEEWVYDEVLTYEDLTWIAFPHHEVKPDKLFSITFEKAASTPHHGTLAEHGKVSVRKGTTFDVIETNRS